MNWQDEPWIKLYTRDTVEFKLLPWQARCVLGLVMRKLDRAGVMDIGSYEPEQAISAMVDVPLEVVSVGVDALLKAGTLEVVGSAVVCPNFIDAQTARQSDKARAKASRERRRDLAKGVTECDAPVTKRDETVTPRHTESHGVTNRIEESREEENRSDQINNLPDAPTGAPSIPEQIHSLQSRYVSGLVTDCRTSCALSRRSGKMSDSVWLQVLTKLSKHPVISVENAMRVFSDKYADGEKDERYLLGIVRGNAKGNRSNGNGYVNATPFEDFPDNEPDDYDELSRLAGE